MEWFAMLIPIMLTIGGYILFRHSITWWELLLAPTVSIIVILACKAIVVHAVTRDTEYKGSMIVEARYYEYWETWVSRTCSYTTCSGSGKSQTCTTHYYDCSYCSEHGPEWIAYDDAGNSWSISKEYYQKLVNKWSATPQFVELNRNIHYHGSCGKDGDMYAVRWNGAVEKSEGAVSEHTYENKIQASHSAFKLPYVSDTQARKAGLYAYPGYYDYYKQVVILGLDKIMQGSERDRIETKFQYINGKFGKSNKVKLFVCLFFGKPQEVAFLQQAYWDGGNQNEIVICIGLDQHGRQIQWVKPFSWTDQSRVLIDLREDIASLGTFQPDSVYSIVTRSMGNHIIYKNFKRDFNYLDVDIPTWGMWLIYILTLLTSVGTMWFCIVNEFTSETFKDDQVSIFYHKRIKQKNNYHYYEQQARQGIRRIPSSTRSVEKIRRDFLRKKDFH